MTDVLLLQHGSLLTYLRVRKKEFYGDFLGLLDMALQVCVMFKKIDGANDLLLCTHQWAQSIVECYLMEISIFILILFCLSANY